MIVALSGARDSSVSNNYLLGRFSKVQSYVRLICADISTGRQDMVMEISHPHSLFMFILCRFQTKITFFNKLM